MFIYPSQPLFRVPHAVESRFDVGLGQPIANWAKRVEPSSGVVGVME